MKRKKRSLQGLMYEAFYNTESRLFYITNDIVAILAVISVVVLMIESLDIGKTYEAELHIIEYVLVCIFTAEYVCRIIGSPKKLHYLLSFYGIIDLLTILPSWSALGNLTALKSARSLHVLRFLRILRLAKAVRGARSQEDAVAIYRLNLGIYAIALAATVIVLGNALYSFEGGQNGFTNIPISILWVLEAILGGKTLGLTPTTAGGIAVALTTRLVALILLGLVIKVVSDIVTRLLLGIKEIDGEKAIRGQV
jgi:voltage-gated potassium channel